MCIYWSIGSNIQRIAHRDRDTIKGISNLIFIFAVLFDCCIDTTIIENNIFALFPIFILYNFSWGLLKQTWLNSNGAKFVCRNH